MSTAIALEAQGEEMIIKRPKCPTCGANQAYFRLRKEDWVCKACGYFWKELTKEKKK